MPRTKGSLCLFISLIESTGDDAGTDPMLLFEKIDEARLDRSVADERLKLFRVRMCDHVSDNASLIDRNCHEDLSPERGSVLRLGRRLLVN